MRRILKQGTALLAVAAVTAVCLLLPTRLFALSDEGRMEETDTGRGEIVIRKSSPVSYEKKLELFYENPENIRMILVHSTSAETKEIKQTLRREIQAMRKEGLLPAKFKSEKENKITYVQREFAVNVRKPEEYMYVWTAQIENKQAGSLLAAVLDEYSQKIISCRMSVIAPDRAGKMLSGTEIQEKNAGYLGSEDIAKSPYAAVFIGKYFFSTGLYAFEDVGGFDAASVSESSNIYKYNK